MDDIISFKKKINSYIKRSEDGNVCLTNFLDEAELSFTLEILKSTSVKGYFNGGIINASRVRCIFSLYEVEDSDFKIKVYKIIYNKNFYKMNHRSILGALMGLGIKRECIGDIVINDKEEAFFSCTSEIEPYILENFNSVGKASITLQKVDYPIINEIKYDSKLYFLSSLRLDVIISGVYGLSRNESLEILKTGDVFVNQILNQNPSHNLKEDDVISIRHKGKIKILQIKGNSKSGRFVIEIGKRI